MTWLRSINRWAWWLLAATLLSVSGAVAQQRATFYAGWVRTIPPGDSLKLTLTLHSLDSLTGYIQIGRLGDPTRIAGSGPVRGQRWGDSIVFVHDGPDGWIWWVGQLSARSIQGRLIARLGPFEGQQGLWSVDLDGIEPGLIPGDLRWAHAPPPWPKLGPVPDIVAARRVEPSREQTGAEPAFVSAGSFKPVPPELSRYTEAGSGTGIVIRTSGLILTAAHVVSGCQALGTTRPGEAIERLRAVDVSLGSDLALLRAGHPYPAAASLRVGPVLRLGEPVLAVGFPLRGILAEAPNVTTGIVSSLVGPGNSRVLIQITAPVQPGNSGGPLLDQAGRLVGVVVSKLNAIGVAAQTGTLPENVNFAVRASAIEAFLAHDGVSLERATTKGPLSTTDLAQMGADMAVIVICYR